MHDDDAPAGLNRRHFIQASAAGWVATQARPALARAKPKGETTCAGYIVARMAELGAQTLFGVPGATCDPLFAAAAEALSGMTVTITASDLEAGYAADGYARLQGVSALSVTYGVGVMSLIGVIGGAYAERSPICVFSGGPHGTDLRLQREYDTYFSHSIGKDDTDLTLFKEVTAAAVRAEKASEVPSLVDQALSTALRERRPVYVEIPKHLWTARCDAPRGKLNGTPAASGHERQQAQAIAARLSKAKRPVVLLGAEVQRYGLSEQARALVQKLEVPWSTTLLGKSVIAETTPGYAGTYVGFRSRPELRELVEGSDAVLALGCVFGRQYRTLATRSFKQLTVVANGAVRAPGQKKGKPASLAALLDALLNTPYTAKKAHRKVGPLQDLSFKGRRQRLPKPPGEAKGLGYDALLGAVSDTLSERDLVITDTSLSMYPAADLQVAGTDAFLCNGVWQSIGFSVGAAVGAAVAEQVSGRGRRPVVICGDGGFQMTAQSLSSLARRRLPALVIVLDNGRYAIEQFLLDKAYFTGGAPGIPYLDLNRWHYADLARALGFEHAHTVADLPALQRALAAAKAAKGPVLISATLDERDMPSQLHL